MHDWFYLTSESFSLWAARPAGDSTCSLQSVNSVDLQYYCQWPGGTPPARLSFPALNSSRSGEGNLSLIFPASPDLDGKMVTCLADHPVELSNCSITAGTFWPFHRSSSRQPVVLPRTLVAGAKPEPCPSQGGPACSCQLSGPRWTLMAKYW